MMSNMTKLGFIGTGNMGSAIINGLAKTGFSAEIYAYDKDGEKLAAVPAIPCGSAPELVALCKYVLLAVKPQVLGAVLDEIKTSVTNETVFISICAGISEQFIRSHTVPDAKVVLVMPNTPMMLGMGASAMSTDDKTTAEEFAFAKSVIESCGIAEVVPIDKMKEIICINGSSPAFIYLFAKGFIDYAASVGIDRAAAEELFTQSLIGSAKMITDSGNTIDELIKMVSSPGGTTLAGLDKLYEGNLTDVVKKCCESCTNRAYELSK